VEEVGYDPARAVYLPTVVPPLLSLNRFQCEAITASQEYLAQQMDARVNAIKGAFKQFHRATMSLFVLMKILMMTSSPLITVVLLGD
jgi:hypothetical protein